MTLQSVIRQVLLVFGEHHAVDLAVSSFAGQVDVLVYFGQFRTQCSHGPLQVRVLGNGCFLVSEVPNLLAPVLQVHVSQVGASTDEYFDSAVMETSRVFVRKGFCQHGRFGTFFEDDHGVRKIRATIAEASKQVNRLFNNHVARHEQESS